MTAVRTIREQITDRIRAEVVAGKLPAGPLRETALAKRFGVSRGPIRDAFLQLSQEGLLNYHTNRGVTIRQPPDPANRAFIVTLRLQIECFVVRRGMMQMKEGGLASIESALGELEVACIGSDTAAVALRDVAFHESILVACGGESILPTWKSLCYQMLFAYSRLPDYRQLLEEHRRIYQALRSRKKSSVIATLKANII